MFTNAYLFLHFIALTDFIFNVEGIRCLSMCKSRQSIIGFAVMSCEGAWQVVLWVRTTWPHKTLLNVILHLHVKAHFFTLLYNMAES